MRYRNPPRKHTSAHNVQKGERRELLRLLLIVSALVLGTMFVLDRAALWLAPRVPFAWEVGMAQRLGMERLPAAMMGGKAGEANPRARQIEVALQARVDRLAQLLKLPPEMKITAHYVESPTVNAVATLGGHVTVFSGLLDKLEYQEELDAVLAHEMGHVSQRHMLRHLSRGLTTLAALQVVGIRSSSLTRWLIGDAQQLQQLAYSREAEEEADTVALQGSQALHGHTQGAVRLFERFDALRKEKGGGQHEALAFLQSHPLPQKRKENAAAQSAHTQRLTPLGPPWRDAALTAPAGDALP